MAENNEQQPKITKQDEEAAKLLAQGHTQEYAASGSGLSPKTISRRMKCDWFRELVMKYRRACIGRAAGKYSNMLVKGAERLFKMIDSPDVDDKTALDAIKELNKSALKYNEHIDILERLERLEQRASERGMG